VGDTQALKAGHHEIVVDFAYDGGFGAGGVATMFVDDRKVGSVRIEKTVPLVYSMSGETFDIGVDTGSPVGNYPHLFTCTADIIGVTIERLDEPSAATKQKMREGEFKASISTQ
jgi:arylsulfatase